MATLPQFENPAKVDRIELTRAGKQKDGRVIINLYTEPLEFAWCSLFESQFGLLLNVGIDPNQLQPGQPHYTNFLAHWTEATNGDGRPKLNSKGNPYKLIERLESPVAQPDPAVAQMAADIQAIKAMLEFLINNQEMAQPQPAPTPAPEATAEPDAPEVKLFDMFYGSGDQAVDPDNPAEVTAFNDYKRAHDERAPRSREALRKWRQAQK